MAVSAGLRVSGVTRRFGSSVVLRDVSFDLAPGGPALMLGPNGAGKTTLLRLLSGYLVPHAGTVRITGRRGSGDPADPACRRSIGYLPEGAPLYGDMSVGAVLVHLARARGLTARVARDRAERLASELALDAHLARPIRTLSRGQRQRVGIAQALVGDPLVVLLDEPTTGLDPHEVDRAWALLVAEAAERVVLCSTHALDRPPPRVSTVLVLDAGALVAQGAPDQLGQGSLGESYRAIIDRGRPD